MPKRLNQTIRAVACSAALAVTLVIAPAADADSLQRGDLPVVEGITLIGVADGQLRYRTSAGERSVELSEINALVIESVPQFGAGQTALQAGQLRSAERAFEDVWSDSRVDWIRHYAGYYLARVYDQRNKPVEAGQVYARLAEQDADLFFLSSPPTASLTDANDDQKKRIGDEVLAVIAKTEGETRDALQAYLKVVLGDAAAIPQIAPDEDDKQAEKRSESAVFLPERIWKLQDREDEQDKWAAIGFLSDGKPQEALDAMKPWLSNPGDLADKLFIYGRAQLALADEKKDADLYRDAGLTFMRIVVHFTRTGEPHALVAPARLEVAYIHKQIDREDIYSRILFGGEDGGGVNLTIDDAQAYPQYRLRYYQVIGESPPEEE